MTQMVSREIEVRSGTDDESLLIWPKKLASDFGVDSAELPSYLTIEVGGRQLGVLRLERETRAYAHLAFVSPHAMLSGALKTGDTVQIAPATETEFEEHVRHHQRWRRRFFFTGAACALAAALVEVSWSVGKYWDWWHPTDFWAGLSQLAKWVLGVLGVGVAARYREYRELK